MHLKTSFCLIVAGYIFFCLQMSSAQEEKNMSSLLQVTSNSKIAFASKRDGNYQIYTIKANGTELTRLTNNTFQDTWPSWSPDGLQIAFVSNREKGSAIYIMNSDGSDVKRLTDPKGEINYPKWSLDGKQIAYSLTTDRRVDIYSVNIDGTNQKELLKEAMCLSWNPNGQQYIFNRGNIPQIMKMNADGSNINPFFASGNTFRIDLFPVWSPDGNRLLFTKPSAQKGSSSMNYEIFTASDTGENEKQLTNYSGMDMAYSWSPDGKQIVFMSDRDGNPELYKMNSDGSEILRLTNNPAEDSQASWSPILLNKK
jgi:Tol biopolymer transport system component